MNTYPILDLIREGFVFFDGGTGTLLQAAGLSAGELPERWNLSHGDVVRGLHRDYLLAGCHIIKSNTFGANALKFPDPSEQETVIRTAMQHAHAAVAEAEALGAAGPHFVALVLGPSGKLLEPLGDLSFEDAVALFGRMVEIGKDLADLILIETMSDGYEAKAALLAAKEHAALPVFVTTVYDEKARLLTGASPAAMATMLEGLGADAIGMNCGLGPAQMKPILTELAKWSSLPLIVNPNAGLPLVEGGATRFPVGPAEFAEKMKELASLGGRVLGGCCGTSPAHLKAVIQAVAGMEPQPLREKEFTLISSSREALSIGEKPLLIGERINPTGKSRLKQALRENDLNYILEEGLCQQEKGAHILDVNVGLPEIDEAAMMEAAVRGLQRVSPLPLQIDTASPTVMERSLRLYQGKALINSVNGKEESMAAVFPLAKKYGGVVIGLTLDEAGIPPTAEGRLAIAEKIVARAADFGLGKKRYRDRPADPYRQRGTRRGPGNVARGGADQRKAGRQREPGGLQRLLRSAPARADERGLFLPWPWNAAWIWLS